MGVQELSHQVHSAEVAHLDERGNERCDKYDRIILFLLLMDR